MSSIYPGAVGRALNVILGERPAVTDFRRSDDDPDDWGPAFQRAADAAQSLGGREILVPAADEAYRIKTPVEIAAPYRNIYFKGQGEASRIERFAALPAGKGLFNIRGRHVGLWQMAIDGRVTTPVGLRYGIIGMGGDFNNDPYHPLLTNNSSIWLHAGAQDISLAALTVEHTGGYACLIDAEDGDIERVVIEQWRLANCRPHLFGLTSGDMNYGSWTGGIFYRSDCTAAKPYRVRGLTVRNSKFRRSTGNMVWGHCEAFHVHHENVNVIDACEFEDIGRDGVLFANVDGGECSGAIFRRIGYITRTDSDTPDPQLLADFALYAVALDTSGWARGLNYDNNKFFSVHGGAIDLDGFRDGAVRGNFDDGTVTGSPEVDLHIGINLGDTQMNGAAERITIAGNHLYYSNAGAIRLNHAKNCLVEGNVIRHRSDAAEPPIRIWSDANRATGNRIIHNDVDYTGAFACVAEQGTLDSTCRNIVYGTIVRGTNAGEFAKLPATASYGGSIAADRHLVLRSDAFSDAQANQYDSSHALIRRASGGAVEVSIERDGGGNRVWLALSGAAAAGPAGAVQYRSAAGFAGEASFLWDATDKQLRVAGLTGTAAIAATQGFIQSHEGFLTLSNAANAVNAPNGGVFALTLTSQRAGGGDQLIFIRPGVADWRWVIDADGSLRLYDNANAMSRVRFGPFLTLAKTDSGLEGGQLRLEAATGTNHCEIDWYDGTVRFFGASAPNHIRAVFWGKTAEPGLAVVNGYMQAAEGFYSEHTAFNTVNAPNGGMTARAFAATRNDGDDQFTFIRTSGVSRTYGMGVRSDGFLTLRDATSALTRLWLNPNGQMQIAGGGSGVYGLNLITGFMQSAEGFYSEHTAFNTVNIPNGGVNALRLTGGSVYVSGLEVISSGAIFQGLGVACIVGGVGYGIAGAGFNPYLGGVQYFGQTLAARRVITAVRNNGGTNEYKYRDEDIRGGVLTAIGAESDWVAF
jgi:hypothetical protein